MTIELTEAPERTSWRSMPPPLALVPISALAWWLVGFLAWLLNGAGHEVLVARGVGFLALPLLSGGVLQLVLGAGVGGVVAGLAAGLGAGTRVMRAAACAAGLAIALLVTLLQTRSGLDGSAIDGRITDGLTLVVILTTIVGLGLGLLSLTGRVGLGFAIGALAGATPTWVMSVFNALEVDSTRDGLEVAHRVSEWSGAVALAVALICVGLQPAVRSVAWAGIVLLAWFVGPTMTAAGYMEVFLRPGMGLPDMWGDQLSAAVDVWRMAASLDGRSLTPWITSIVVAAAVSLWLARRPAAPPWQPAQ